MTLLPSNEFGIRGYPGKPYDVNEICAVPGCGQPSAHAHHLWARSFLRGQPYEYVQLPDGTVIGNRCGLCREHHDMVTGEIGGYRARILFSSGVFWWEELRKLVEWRETGWGDEPGWHRVGALDPQPPGAGEATERPKADKNGLASSDEVCPTCGHHKRRRASTPGEARKAKDWTLKVPDDVEIGAEILDEWADEIAVVLGFSDETSRLRRYHAVATALAWTMQNRDEFVKDLLAAR